MELKSILSGIEGVKAKANLNTNIDIIESDSRKIKPNGMFVAIRGFEVDGSLYVKQAVDNGAVAIVIEEGTKLKKSDIKEDTNIIMVPDARIALAKMACNFYGNPSRKFKLIGVTGTKGKTTTTYMIKEILEKAGHKVGLIGTIATYINGKRIKDSDRTTPKNICTNGGSRC